MRRRRQLGGRIVFVGDRAYSQLGDTWTDLQKLLQTAKGSAQAAGKVLEDPALPQITSLVLELNSIQAAQGKKSATAPGKGVGLVDLVSPLKAFVYYQKNRWIAPVGIVAALAIPFTIGYMVGKRRK